MYNLLDNQVELILKSLEYYTKEHKENLQLISATYETLLFQKTNKCNKNVTQNLQKCYRQNKNYSIKWI